MNINKEKNIYNIENAIEILKNNKKKNLLKVLIYQ